MVSDAADRDKSFSVSGVLKILGISTSGYYDWKNRKMSKHQQEKRDICIEIAKIYIDNYKIYGAPKITAILRQKVYKISKRTVGKYMREMGFKAKYIRPYTRTTINSDFSEKLTNVLNREFNPDRPNAVWCTDITYIWTIEDGFVYLTCVIDLFSRKIIFYVLTKTMGVDDVLKAIDLAKGKRNYNDRPLIIHSDRGVQFTSSMYSSITEGITTSYSNKGTPWDNACIESFQALIKREWLNDKKIKNYDEAGKLIFEYIETFYNTTRIHSHCNFVSPNTYEANYDKHSTLLLSENLT